MAAAMPLVGDVRGRGLLSAVELVSDEDTLAPFPPGVDPGAVVLPHGLDHGLLLYSRRQNAGRYGDWLLVAPPLVIDDKTADELVERFAATLTAATDDLRRACA
jgi:adenosylmethionine-8-amino-7-oxononanoate aminotransferase